MKLLAFDTSTEVLSIALGWDEGGPGGARLLERRLPGGARSSTTLIPQLLALLAEAGFGARQLDAIVFGRGPGSFTGLRTACSVAQGLAFGAGVPVLGVETLLAVAEQARHAHGASRVMAVLDARMDEVYCAGWEHDGRDWVARQPAALVAPEQVLLPEGFVLAGNAAQAYPGRLPAAADSFDLLPEAAAMLRLAPALLAAGQATDAAGAMPLYLRDKVAQTTEERAALKAAAGASGAAAGAGGETLAAGAVGPGGGSA